ncbi:MAG: hypothetical protein KatS3mg028_0040 [Bacteroidia bacterium]|nr:MAG: hypothetical protein KatS3mg028_0040 [Bacteroidia bacterium]
MLFVTFNDYPGGIYYSQVIDVIGYLNEWCGDKIRLVSFISLRNFFENRRKIKTRYANTIVLPMFPGVGNWKWNRVWMFFIAVFFFRSSVICRGIFSYHIVYPFRKIGWFRRIILDARGAYKAEFEEYRVIDDTKIIRDIENMERAAIKTADFKIAVSEALVDYWKNEYQYSGKNHVVIPCSLSKNFMRKFPDKTVIDRMKADKGFSVDDIIIVFSGSSSGWQSLKQSDELFLKLLDENEKIKLIFLGKHKVSEYNVYKKYPGRVMQKQVEEREVLDFLYIADYGWLVREQSITNRVASPVKFAEYLSAGLKVIISENLGDYSEFCVKNDCGIVVKNNEFIQVSKQEYEEKLRIHHLAMQYFTKERYKSEYEKVIKG